MTIEKLEERAKDLRPLGAVPVFISFRAFVFLDHSLCLPVEHSCRVDRTPVEPITSSAKASQPLLARR